MLLPRVKSQKRTDHNVTGPGGNLKREESIRSLIIYTFFLFDLVEYHLLNFLLLKILQWLSWNNYIHLLNFQDIIFLNNVNLFVLMFVHKFLKFVVMLFVQYYD